MSAISEQAAMHYRVFCELNAIITGDQAEASHRLELLDGAVAPSRIRALYPLDTDAIYEALVEKLRDQQSLESFMLAAMAAYNPLTLDPLLYEAYDVASDWSDAFSNTLAGRLNDFSDSFFEQVPENWVVTNPPVFHCYDIALALYKAVYAAENWDAWSVRYAASQKQQSEAGSDPERWIPPYLDEASVILSAYMRDIKPVLTSLTQA